MQICTHRLGRLGLALFTLLLSTGNCLQAGPPVRTDDPEPVALGHAEFYVAGIATLTAEDKVLSAPLLEFNYGAFPNLQLHLVVPFVQVQPAGEAWARGYGDTELGVKYRIIQETDTLPQVGIFPMVELPTGNADRGLGSGHTAVYVPLWLQKSFGKWTTYGGYGWWRNPGEGQRNWSYRGWLLQREVVEALTLGGEVFRTTASTQEGSNAVGWNLGAVINLNEHHHLLVSAGRNFSGPSETHAYLGYQFTFTAGSRALNTAEHLHH